MKNVILVIAGFAGYHFGFSHFEAIMLFIDKLLHYRLGSYFLAYILIGIPIFIATCIINKDVNFISHLGLQSNIVKALAVALIFSLPMFIGGFLKFTLTRDISVPNLIAKTIFAGLFEELYFRGFFFGQLYRKSRLGFLPSILICSMLFAAGHLYQSNDPGTVTGILLTTFMGSILFAWLYVEWQFNLWVPVFLHTLMNLSWAVFSMSDNALGNMYANIFRGLTIAISIIVTLAYKKRRGQHLMITKNTLLIKKALPLTLGLQQAVGK